MAYDTSAHEHEFFAVQPETETRSHLRNRPWKACLEQLKAQNDLLTFHALAFSDFLRDAAPPPALNLGALLYPGRDPESNFSDCVLGKLRRLMLADVPAAVAALPITLIASKTTATLLATLETIHASGPLVEARRAIRGIFDILHDPVRPFASPERRAAEINGLFDSFLAACRTNATTFTTLWDDHCHPLLATRHAHPDAARPLSHADFSAAHTETIDRINSWGRQLNAPLVSLEASVGGMRDFFLDRLRFAPSAPKPTREDFARAASDRYAGTASIKPEIRRAQVKAVIDYSYDHPLRGTDSSIAKRYRSPEAPTLYAAVCAVFAAHPEWAKAADGYRTAKSLYSGCRQCELRRANPVAFNYAKL